jgi:cytochrome c oxidase assembly protein subunit 11
MSQQTDRKLPWKLAGLVAAMFAFGFALVPLYDAFCALTGYGGKTAGVSEQLVEEPDPSRTVRVEFVASVARGAPWT